MRELFGNRYTSSNGSDGSAHRDPETSAYVIPNTSVDHLLKFLHRESSHRLACWLRLEDAWLFGEGVDALSSWTSRFLLQLQVQRTSKLEGAVLLQLISRHGDNTFHDGLHILRLEASGLGD